MSFVDGMGHGKVQWKSGITVEMQGMLDNCDKGINDGEFQLVSEL